MIMEDHDEHHLHRSWRKIANNVHANYCITPMTMDNEVSNLIKRQWTTAATLAETEGQGLEMSSERTQFMQAPAAKKSQRDDDLSGEGSKKDPYILEGAPMWCSKVGHG